MAKLPMPFGGPTTYPGHSGVDFPQPLGTPIPASGDGVVTHRNITRNGGYQIWVRYDINGKRVGYAHMPSHHQCPPVGTRVRAGTKLGVVGLTGRTDGPHLHAEIDGDATTAGFWRAFTRDAVVGGSPAGGSGTADLKAGQRTVKAPGVKRRTQPTSKSALAGEGLDTGEIGNFVGWIRGESVDGNNVWLQGISGDWFWSGGFVEGSTTIGLTDLNAAKLQPTQRQVLASDIVRRRDEPSTSSREAGDPLPAGTVGNFDGWTRGQKVDGNDVWFRGISGDWFWSGGFVGGAKTSGLPEVTENVTPEPPAGSVLDPAAPWKDQPVDYDDAQWIGSPNFNNGKAPARRKDHIDLHWFGSSSSLAGTDAHFQQPGEIKNGRGTGASSQYGIGADGTVHQYVREVDYAHTNGDTDANATGITIEHEGGPGKPITDATYEASIRLVADIARRIGITELVWERNIFPHRHYVDTECPGTLDHVRIIAGANALLAPVADGTVMVPRAELEALRDVVDGWLS